MPWLHDEDRPDGATGAGAPSDREPPLSFERALSALESLADEIATSTTAPEVIAAVARSAQLLPGPPAVTVGIVDPGTDDLRIVALEGFDGADASAWRTVPLAAETPLTKALLTNSPVYVRSKAIMAREYPLLRDDIDRSGRQRWAAVPLSAPTGSAGVIGLGWDDTGEFPGPERLYLLTLARMGGEALRRVAREIDRTELVLRLAEASSNERVEIARDLHDLAIQRLAAVHIRLGTLAMDRDDPEIVAIEREVQKVIETLRDLIADLHPPDTDGLDLTTALVDLGSWLFDDTVTVVVRGPTVPLDDGPATAIFKIAQEALVNAHKHARATAVWVTVTHEAGMLGVEVRDDGVGVELDSQPGTGHIGLQTMQERAARLGGSIELRSQDGTTVRASVPCP